MNSSVQERRPSCESGRANPTSDGIADITWCGCRSIENERIFGEMRRGVGRIVRELCQRPRRGVGGRARAVGSRACLVGYSTEVECGDHGGVLEREVGDPHSSGVSGAAAQLHGLHTFGRAGTASAPSVWRKRSSAITSRSRKRTRRNRRNWNLANRRPLRGAFLIPPPQGAVADWRHTIERLKAKFPGWQH